MWIDGIVAVIEPVSHLCAGKVVNHRATHGELIQVVVRKMSDDLSHLNSFSYENALAPLRVPSSYEELFVNTHWLVFHIANADATVHLGYLHTSA